MSSATVAPGAAANAGQVEYWNGRAGQRWASWYERLDRGMADITEALLAFAAPTAGEHVLDVGCGCGTTALAAAARVAPRGSVDAVDISRPMLEVARARVRQSAAPVQVLEGDAAALSYAHPYDLILSRFGVMFFEEPVWAFARLRAALAPGGRMVFVTWRTFSQNTWAYGPYQAGAPLLPPPQPPVPDAPGPFTFADPERLIRVLREAGFGRVHVQALDLHLGLGADVEQAVEQSMVIGPLAAATAEAEPGTRERIRERLRALLSDWTSQEGVRGLAACWLVRAQA